ncbi:TetR/AcrR family transcriptional regulator [Streptomyces pinistramenti]|uniref:TetR/AcrR family transcriptional regulator n=1 Tax=Streptomyces pinistramenti TaxID=2884812 RepID=UPI001D05D0FF|nr:TetR/AcrR family transcriptional regulator [Streptomyces pinistramenti]MCB5911567.1 TetR/AcrR family transcriptional regulator [Streptomyces pinistramenti]
MDTSEGQARPPRRIRNPQRTRQAIVDALLSAIEEGEISPTARGIAQRAGVSERSVFVHFRDLDDLRLTVARQQAERVAKLISPVPQDWPLEKRLDTLLAQQEEVFALQIRVRIAALVHAQQSPALAAVMVEMNRKYRDRLATVFAPELSAVDEAAGAELLDILEPVLGWSFRYHLSEQRGVDRERVTRAARRTALAVLREKG